MIKFSGQKGATSIRGRDLDANFSRLQPVPNGTYGINQSDAGWSLNIFPAFPATASTALYLTYIGGSLQWRAVDTPAGGGGGGGGGSVSPSAISPGPDGSLFTTISGSAQWSAAPPSGTPQWIQVERCDGQQMYVWGTAWAEPA